jgi:hypothetical protein
MSHFAVSYVLRYAGVLDEAARECNRLSLDPANYQLRSCSFVFDLLVITIRAMDFLKLDMGSEWVAANLPLHYQRAGNLAQARESNKVVTGFAPFQQLNSACLNQASPSEIDHLAHEAMPVFLADPDPENRYWNAAVLAACRQNEFALQLLKSSVQVHYCLYSALQNDPLLANLRHSPEFTQLLSTSKKCQDDFLAARNQTAN